jgi:hypothetical protein
MGGRGKGVAVLTSVWAESKRPASRRADMDSRAASIPGGGDLGHWRQWREFEIGIGVWRLEPLVLKGLTDDSLVTAEVTRNATVASGVHAAVSAATLIDIEHVLELSEFVAWLQF